MVLPAGIPTTPSTGNHLPVELCASSAGGMIFRVELWDRAMFVLASPYCSQPVSASTSGRVASISPKSIVSVIG